MTMRNYTYNRAQWVATTLVAICLAVSLVAQQNADVDSLRNRLRTLRFQSQEYLKTQVNLANYWVYRDLDSATWHIDQVLQTPNLGKLLPPGYARHYLVKAWTYHGRMMLKEAKVWYFKALNVAQQGASDADIREIELNLGAMLTDMQDPDAKKFALDIIGQVDPPKSREEKEFWIVAHLYLVRIAEYQDELNEALSILRQLQDNPILHEFPDYRYGVLNSTAIVLDRMGDGQLAVRYYRKALKIPQLYDFEQKELLLNMASTWLDLEQPDSCLYYLEVAQAVATLSENEQWAYFFARARARWSMDQTAAARNDIEKALQVAHLTKNDSYVLRSLVKKAEFAAADNQWTEVQSLLHEAEPYWERVDNLEAQVLNAMLRWKAATALSRPDLLPKLDEYIALNDRYTNLKNNRQLKQVVYQYEVRQREQENELLRQELAIQYQRRRVQFLGLCLLALAALAALGMAAFWRRNTRLTQQYNTLLEEEKGQLVFEQEELQTVNAQLHDQLVQLARNAPPENLPTIEIQGRDQVHLLAAHDISHLTAEHEGVRYHLANGHSLWSDKPLRDALEQLPPMVFMQTYRSVVVNIRHIACINHRTVKMKDGVELPIGRVYKQDIRSRFEGF